MQRERRAERKVTRLNESPSQKEGKYLAKKLRKYCRCCSLNESPSQKEGKFRVHKSLLWKFHSLNESPSQKEGKFRAFGGDWSALKPQ